MYFTSNVRAFLKRKDISAGFHDFKELYEIQLLGES